MKIVYHILVFYFSVGACIPKSDFSQLMRLDDMMEHFELHQEESQKIGESISFASFLYVHYIAGDQHEHDNEHEHHNLPYQSMSSSATFYVADFHSFADLTTFSPADSFISFLETTLNDGFRFDVFQPPTFA